MWNIAICDDEQTVQQELSALWQKHFTAECYQLHCFSSGLDLLQAAKTTSFDCIYLDIQMSQINGIEAAKKLRATGCTSPIIFLTNYDDYLETGYEVQAFRYRFKPVQEDTFLKDIAAWQAMQQQKELLLVSTADGAYQIALNELIYVEIVSRRVQVVTMEGTYISTESMQHWETILPDSYFLTPYNKILVNAHHVKFFDQNNVITTGGHQLPMSRRKYQQFKARMMHL